MTKKQCWECDGTGQVLENAEPPWRVQVECAGGWVFLAWFQLEGDAWGYADRQLLARVWKGDRMVAEVTWLPDRNGLRKVQRIIEEPI